MNLTLFVDPAEKKASYAISIIPSQVILPLDVLMRMTNG